MVWERNPRPPPQQRWRIVWARHEVAVYVHWGSIFWSQIWLASQLIKPKHNTKHKRNGLIVLQRDKYHVFGSETHPRLLIHDITHQVVVDSAGQKPVSNVVSHHFSRGAGAWGKTDCVCMTIQCSQNLAMEMDWMDVHLCLKGLQKAWNKHIYTFRNKKKSIRS